MIATVVAIVTAALAFVVSVLTIREKLRPRGAHPLEAAVRDVAAAVRERGPDFHLLRWTAGRTNGGPTKLAQAAPSRLTHVGRAR